MIRVDTPDHWMVPVGSIQRLSAADNGFDAYTADDLQELALFIKAHGPRALQPVVLSPDHILVDGYARLAAAVLAGLKAIPAYVFAYDDRCELLQHRIALNTKRTHLDADTQASMAARLQVLNERGARRLAGSPTKTDRARAKAMRVMVGHGAAVSAGGVA